MPSRSAHIYFARLEGTTAGSFEQQYLAVMPVEIRKSIMCYRQSQDRWATLCGKVLLLRALQIHFLDAGIRLFQSLEKTQDGKPFIMGGPEFNISHSGDMVTLAVNLDGIIGIDIEEIHDVNVEEFIHAMPEIASLIEDYTVDKSYFFDCWTQKEAVLKACGKGLLEPMEQIALQEGKAYFADTEWFLKKLQIDERYCCHVATDRPLEQVHLERVNLIKSVL